MAYGEITVGELLALGAAVRVIDVREPDEWADGHIPWAVHVPLATVPDQLDRVRRRRRPTSICQVGRTQRPRLRVRRRPAASTRSTWSAGCSPGRRPASPPTTLATTDGSTPSTRHELERIDYRWVDRRTNSTASSTRCSPVDRYALDTEFHRERTYFPKLALIQVAWLDDGARRQQVALDRPVDRRRAMRSRRCSTSDVLCVIHAAQQDLDVLTHAAGAVPARMFDTQIAAGFAGYGTPSLVSLLQGEVGVSPAKGDRLTDWLRRPLSDDQMQYAAVDVEYLLEVHDLLAAKLAGARPYRVGRRSVRGTAHDAGERGAPRTTRGCGSRTPARCGRARAASPAPSPHGGNGGRCASTSRCARCCPTSPCSGSPSVRRRRSKELSPGARRRRPARPRLPSPRRSSSRCSEGKAAPAPPTPPSADDLERNLRPAVALISAWISQLARDESVDTALLATRADLVAFLRGDDDARLGNGWRAELLGDGIRSPGRRRIGADVRRPGPPPPDSRRPMRSRVRCVSRAVLEIRRRAVQVRVFPGWSGTIHPQCQLSSVGALS